MKGDCRLCNQLRMQPLLSAQALKMIASPRLLKVQASARRTHSAPWCTALFVGSISHVLYWADVPLWTPSDARCASTPVPFLLIHELVLQLVSGDTVGDWLGCADGRQEFAITLEDWKERVDMSSKGPPCAAFSLWGDTTSYHTGFDSVMFLLWSPLTGTVRQRFWFVALSKETLCKCGCGGRHTLGPCWNVAKWCFDNMLRGCMATRKA